MHGRQKGALCQLATIYTAYFEVETTQFGDHAGVPHCGWLYSRVAGGYSSVDTYVGGSFSYVG